MNTNENLLLAAEWLRTSRHTVVFTGAGVSAESGIPTFRDAGGFWSDFPIEQFATWQGIAESAVKRPRRLADFVYAVLEPIAKAEPNAAHRAIARLEQHGLVTVVTQNVDNLHQAAGSGAVHELHGSFYEIVTPGGRIVRRLARHDLQRVAESIQRVRSGVAPLARLLWSLRPILGVGPRGFHRPNVVLFGDALPERAWSQALDAARDCSCLIQVGCSGTVLPAAMLPQEAKAGGARVITIDPHSSHGDVWLSGTAADILPQLAAAAYGDG